MIGCQKDDDYTDRGYSSDWDWLLWLVFLGVAAIIVFALLIFFFFATMTSAF